MAEFDLSVEVIESYKEYEPPLDVAAVARDLLAYVPPKGLMGLNSVVLTNASALPRRRRRRRTRARKRKVKVARAWGLYHRKTSTAPAWIEIFVDNIDFDHWMEQRIPIIRDLTLAYVLYHEIGHHVHATLRPEHREREDVADEWRDKLVGYFLYKKYWYLRPLFHLLGWLRRRFNWFQRPT